jgi:hypothetical protein
LIKPEAGRKAGLPQSCLSCCRSEALCRNIIPAPYLKKIGLMASNLEKMGVGEGIEPILDPALPCAWAMPDHERLPHTNNDASGHRHSRSNDIRLP